jgi:hypothetical protein
MTYTRGAALALFVVSASAVPLHDASAWCRWRCGPGPILALPFIAAGAVVAGAATIATAPVRAIAGPGYYAGYYGPPPGYYAPPGYYGYGPPPGYYMPQPGYTPYAPAPQADH